MRSGEDLSEEAASYLRKAANQGFSPAQHMLGVMLQKGEISPNGELSVEELFLRAEKELLSELLLI